jgi:tRNA dimethylallyltransferase
MAERFSGTIINADSAQVYRDLRIVTARPSAEEEACVPHRLFGHVDAADTTHNAARWAADARFAIAETLAEGRLPILVGGTGLYLRTLLDGIAPVPAIDPQVRAEVRALAVTQAHHQLAALDPQAAARLGPADTTRVARALEVIRSTGRTLADWQQHREGGIGGTVDLRAAVLLPDREWLGTRIDHRFATIVDQGLPEVAALLARPDLPADAPIRRAIGVAELAALFSGEIDRDTALRAGALATRQYAKRQFTWFRHQPPPTWIRLYSNERQESAECLATLLL